MEQYNFHPVLSAFPVAIIATAALAEFLDVFLKGRPFRNVSRFLVCVALLAVAAAFISGYQGSELANQTFVISQDYIDQHHSWGRLLLFAIFPCVALKLCSEWATHNRSIFKAFYYSFLLICLGLALRTGFLGGELVFKHGAGVFATPPASKDIP